MNDRLLAACLALLLTGCNDSGSRDPEPGAAGDSAGCSGDCAEERRDGNDDNVRLTVADVQQVIAQGVAEAESRDTEATIAVVDRVGNVLGVWRTSTGPREVLIASAPDGSGGSEISGGLEGLEAEIDPLAAIAKAVTGAYLSSEGNAFSSRTANQIVQNHFNPGERFQPGGPLFGVQFSQLACSDFTDSYNGLGADAGPKRSPLGLAADPGGFPLYKNGTVVGGVGVISDGLYSIDRDINDDDNAGGNDDEAIALAAGFSFSPPQERRANRITVEGKTLRFSDAGAEHLRSDPGSAPPYPPASGQLVSVPGYNNGVINPGLVFGSEDSGIRPADAGQPAEAAFAEQDGFVFVDAAGNNRYPPVAGSAPGGAASLQSDEVTAILEEALQVANRARAQIRRPLGSHSRVTISVVDTDGNVLGMVRSRDAPVFGADVSLQKARTAAFFSSPTAALTLSSGGIDARYVSLDSGGVNTTDTVDFRSYVTAARDFLDRSSALSDGAVAFSDRAGGNLSRPFFPDGIDGNPPGPFSKPQGEWSPFSTGLQLDLVINGIVQHALFAAGAVGTDVTQGCGGIIHDPLGNFVSSGFNHNRLANGIQIFPGSVPIYRDDELIGGIGVSGDGIEQDDLIAFLGLHNAGRQLDGAVNNAPPGIRADTLTPQGTRLRYVQCPQAPFLDSDEQQPCKRK